MTTATSTDANPLLDTTGLPRFDLIEPAHVEPAVRQMLAELDVAIQTLEAKADGTWTGLVEPLQALSEPVERIWEPVTHLLAVKNSDELRDAHKGMLPEIVKFNLRLQQSRAIYEGLKAIQSGPEWNTLTEAQQRVIELRVRDAEHAGVGLDGPKKERFNEIVNELSQLSTDFSNHVLDATKGFELIVTDPADTEDWPTTLRQLAAQSYADAQTGDEKPEASLESGPWRVTLDSPVFFPFMLHSRNRTQREEVYRAYFSRATEGDLDNTDLIRRTLILRRELVDLLGFATHAELSLDAKMAPNVDAIESMWNELAQAARPFAEVDREDIKQLARNSDAPEPFEHWDLGFWTERLREQRFNYTDDDVRPYFPMPQVMDGMFALTERLFGVTIEPADGDAPVWHDDVRYFRIVNGSGDPIASFYLDPYSRPAEKRGGAWMDNCLVRRRSADGQLQLPVVHLTCNGTPPVGNTPSLMSFGEVRTLFHEFGHGLQGMLTTVDEPDIAGVGGVEWDAVEIASQFMENWLYHRPVLMGMARHYQTSEPLPEELFEKLCAARNFTSGLGVLRQIEFGRTDMELHHRFDPSGSESVFDVHRRINEATSVFPYFDGNRFLCAFSHIFAGSYSAGYYSYLWSDVLSADAFAAFEEAGLDDDAAVAALGRSYRDTILALGGGRHPMKVFVDFRKREPTTEALLRHSGLVEA